MTNPGLWWAVFSSCLWSHQSGSLACQKHLVTINWGAYPHVTIAATPFSINEVGDAGANALLLCASNESAHQMKRLWLPGLLWVLLTRHGEMLKVITRHGPKAKQQVKCVVRNIYKTQQKMWASMAFKWRPHSPSHSQLNEAEASTSGNAKGFAQPEKGTVQRLAG